MRTDASQDFCDIPLGFDPQAAALELSAQMARTIAVAQALVSSQRHVDLQGLHDQVGLLCAKALDTPPAQAGFVRAELKRLVSALDALTLSLRENAA